MMNMPNQQTQQIIVSQQQQQINQPQNQYMNNQQVINYIKLSLKFLINHPTFIHMSSRFSKLRQHNRIFNSHFKWLIIMSIKCRQFKCSNKHIHSSRIVSEMDVQIEQLCRLIGKMNIAVMNVSYFIVGMFSEIGFTIIQIISNKTFQPWSKRESLMRFSMAELN